MFIADEKRTMLHLLRVLDRPGSCRSLLQPLQDTLFARAVHAIDGRANASARMSTLWDGSGSWIELDGEGSC